MTGTHLPFPVVNVSAWEPDQDNPIHPVGSQPKRVLVCPERVNEQELIPGHRYLFKVPPKWKRYQTWSEFIASRLGRSIGIDAPRCFIAHDQDGNMGALVEFFFGYSGELHPRRFVHASDLLRTTFTNEKLGKPHSARLNILVCKLVLKIESPELWWGKTLLFDALIGNTDRHPDNWGLLADVITGTRQVQFSLAPAFDNGTSLGYEFPDGSLKKRWTSEQIQRYIARGTHHCGWSGTEPKALSHTGLCRVLARTYPDIRKLMLQILDFPPTLIAEICEPCMAVEVAHPFSEPRSELVCSLVGARQDALKQALGAL